MIKAIIFDVDGVLIDSFEANLKLFQNLMPAAGYPSPTREQYAVLFSLTGADVIKNLIGSSSPEENARILQIYKDHKVIYPVNLVNLSDGVAETIEALNENYLLAVATSRIQQSVYEVPALAKLEKYFRVTAAFENTEKHKPSPDPLLYAAKELGVEPGECVYVGDVENDIKAARAAGMKSILYSKTIAPGADAITADFRDLPGLLKNL